MINSSVNLYNPQLIYVTNNDPDKVILKKSNREVL
jgi:hypothetical protein